MKKVVYISDILSFISCNNHHKNLLVLDIDNTILKGSTSLGSDQWYSWQCQLIKQKSKYSVAYDIEHLNKIINEMYADNFYIAIFDKKNVGKKDGSEKGSSIFNQISFSAKTS